MSLARTTTPKLFCFVLMPFHDSFDDIYRLGIKEACDKAGAYCERVDEQIFHERILDRVYNQIAKADLIIADMTGKNPNVFYEVGYAHALGKPTLLLTQESEDIPFDLKDYPHIVYANKIAFLRDEVEKRVRYFVENPITQASEARLGLQIFLANKPIEVSDTVQIEEHTYPSFELTIGNNSFDGETFRIGMLTSSRFSNSSIPYSNIHPRTTKLPDGSFLHMLPEFQSLFPGAYTSTTFELNETLSAGEVEDMTLKIFTK